MSSVVAPGPRSFFSHTRPRVLPDMASHFKLVAVPPVVMPSVDAADHVRPSAEVAYLMVVTGTKAARPAALISDHATTNGVPAPGEAPTAMLTMPGAVATVTGAVHTPCDNCRATFSRITPPALSGSM